jgi:hypothetical protein
VDVGHDSSPRKRLGPVGIVTQLVTHLYIGGHTREPDMACDLGRGGRI